MTNEKDKSAGYDLAIDWTQSLSGDGIETDEIAHLGARIADLVATVRAEVWNETFRIQCVDCAEGDEPIYSKEARWFYHGISNQEVGCSASKLRIAALEATENRKGEGNAER